MDQEIEAFWSRLNCLEEVDEMEVAETLNVVDCIERLED